MLRYVLKEKISSGICNKYYLYDYKEEKLQFILVLNKKLTDEEILEKVTELFPNGVEIAVQLVKEVL